MITRDLNRAREAYKTGDLDASRRAHSEASEKHQTGHAQYLKSVVYGGLDGIITTFAVVAGVAGAALSASTLFILGAANLIADGLSMGVGDYLSTRAEQEYAATERKREEWEVEHYPEGEERELVELYIGKGLSEQDARELVRTLTRNKKVWVDVMMVEELGILESDESPIRNGIATFLSFAAFGSVPLLVPAAALFWGVVPASQMFPVTCIVTAATLAALGIARSRFSFSSPLRSATEMVLLGGVAAAVAYGVGALLSGIGV